ncbi:IS200/IS605 family accessory protein TnpB-related protein [Metabacillus litoralis]|uniref:IS200/IS605 family accessory protein TnpB-related protein n=1 Tax=Metabacillus litoralis TaxID=152268 RepID=UPI0020409519|nr:IS200/IS605 family accessory protein TnpB-related protein [Metabacillus litoralis]MCM3654282.1 IS200/IS605 family accessory protein TnpB-related protein [Metabacillus litoralis]
MKKAYFSKRIYKNKLSTVYVDAISHSFLLFNRAKHFAIQRQVVEKRSGKSKRDQSLHLTVKKRFDMNDYYTNSVVQEANALMTSQSELKKMYISTKEEQIKSVKKKIKTTKSRVTTLTKIKRSFIKGKPSFNKTSREQQKGNFFVVQFKKKTDIYYHAYQFEHHYLDIQLKALKNRLGRLEFRLDRLQKQLKTLRNQIKSVVFGGEKLFKGQHTLHHYRNNHRLWLENWEQSRYSKMTISGRKDAKYGNFVFSYVSETKNLHFTTLNGVVVDIQNLIFPYGQENVEKAIQTQVNMPSRLKKKYGSAVAWSIEDHGDYYIFKCIVDLPEEKNINHSKSAGVVGVDLNVDHIAWSNINVKGQLIKSGAFEFDLEGKSSGQATKIIEAEAIRLVDLASKLTKPLVIEKLNTTKSKSSNLYGNKKANKKMSMFAYRKLISAIKNRADKMSVAIFEVNPAYTSQIGKIKYMKRLGISIHQAASYVIARRAMGFKEKLPPVLHSLLPEKIVGLHHWTQWKWASNCLSDVHPHCLYQIELSIPSKHYSMSDLFPPGALPDLVAKGLSKKESRKPIA